MRIVIIILILVVYTKAWAQDAPVVNEELKALIQQGFAYFPQIKEIEQQTQTNVMNVDLTKTYRLPTISGNASYNYVTPVSQINNFPVAPGVSETFKFQPYNNVNAYVGLNYTLIDFGRLSSNIRKSKEQLSQAQYNIDLVQSQLASQIANVYYSIIYYREAVSIQDSVIDYLSENKKVTESKINHGDALSIDLLNIQASIDNEVNARISIQNQLQKNIYLLNYTTGLDSIKGNNGNFDFSYNNLNTDDVLKIASDNHPDFLMAKSKIRVAESDVSVSKTQNKPSLNVLANAGYKNGYIPNIYAVRFNYLLGAAVTVPIYAGGRFRQQTAINYNIVKTSQLSVNTLQNTYQKDIASTISDIKSGRERLKNVESQIAQAKANQAYAASRYKNGTATYLDLTSASSTYQRAVYSKLQIQFQLCQANIELARLSGIKYW